MRATVSAPSLRQATLRTVSALGHEELLDAAWDFFFDQPQPAFALVHLANGKRLGGYWGRNSCAGAFPSDGDIYLEAAHAVDESGKFGGPIPNTRGVLLRKEQYTYIELFSPPEPEVLHNEQARPS